MAASSRAVAMGRQAADNQLSSLKRAPEWKKRTTSAFLPPPHGHRTSPPSAWSNQIASFFAASALWVKESGHIGLPLTFLHLCFRETSLCKKTKTLLVERFELSDVSGAHNTPPTHPLPP
ncbi:hypothetical protein FKM82_022605 [Ascaphus truei]